MLVTKFRTAPWAKGSAQSLSPFVFIFFSEKNNKNTFFLGGRVILMQLTKFFHFLEKVFFKPQTRVLIETRGWKAIRNQETQSSSSCMQYE